MCTSSTCTCIYSCKIQVHTHVKVIIYLHFDLKVIINLSFNLHMHIHGKSDSYIFEWHTNPGRKHTFILVKNKEPPTLIEKLSRLIEYFKTDWTAFKTDWTAFKIDWSAFNWPHLLFLFTVHIYRHVYPCSDQILTLGCFQKHSCRYSI